MQLDGRLAWAAHPLNTKTEIDERLSRVRATHVRDLNAMVDELRRTGHRVPYFDPDGGGASACVLVLLSDPGRLGADATGFASIDNPDRTSTNQRLLLGNARLERKQVVHWNIVPWSVAAVGESEKRQGAQSLRTFLTNLRGVKVVVAMGTPAKDGWARIGSDYRGITGLGTWHPSDCGLNGAPGRREHVLETLDQARALCSREK
jgi:hypothetical protein